MDILTPGINQLLQAIGWGLMHSLWQGAVVWLLMIAIFRAFPMMNARLKHGSGLIALLLLTLWTSNTIITQWQQLQTTAVRVVSGNVTQSAGYVINVPPAANSQVAVSSSFSQFQGWMPWLTLCYGVGLLAMLFRLSGGLIQIHRLRTRGISMPSERLLQVMHSLQLQLDVVQKVALRISTHVVIPVVIGALRPMILLPASMVEELGPEGLEAILLHELAHISRSDYLINILLSVVVTLLFFNPFVWRISAAIRREREHCCDDIVVGHTREPLTYARALTTLASLRRNSVPSIALAASGTQGKPLLLNRIKRIIEMKNQPLRSAHIIAACSLAAIVIAVSIACFSPSLAQRSNKQKEEKAIRQENQTATTSAASRIVVTDSNGKRHVYTSIDAMPPKAREAFQSEMQVLRDTLEHHKNLGPMLRANLAGLNDSIRQVVQQSVEAGLASVDWDEINSQIDSAMKEVQQIDWAAINRDISRGLAEADKALRDPKIKIEIDRAMALAQRDVSREMRRARQDHRRVGEDARRDLEQARKDMEQMRKEMREMKEEMRRLKQPEKE